MEHLFFEPSVLQTTVHFSQLADSLPDDVLEKVTDERIRSKPEEMTGLAFMGELELAYFSRQDSEESLVAMQRRLALEHVPQAALAKSDFSPLMEIVGNNASGEQIAAHRHLLAEMISADLLKSFRDHDVTNEANMNSLGRRLRKIVLEPGATTDLNSFNEFTGRTISTKAMLDLYRF